MVKTILVVGATGATGRQVVQMLLDRGDRVVVVVRSKRRMLDAIISPVNVDEQLIIHEASLLDLSEKELEDHVRDCDAVISCLGHNQNFQGLYGSPRRLVTLATQRLTTAMSKVYNSSSKKARFILLAGESVRNPKDGERSMLERSVLFAAHHLMPPFVDNQEAANYLYDSLEESTSLEWCVVRPAQLCDGRGVLVSSYRLYETPPGSLFDGNKSTRANVAHCMTELAVCDDQWKEWRFKMPILHSDVPTE